MQKANEICDVTKACSDLYAIKAQKEAKKKKKEKNFYHIIHL